VRAIVITEFGGPEVLLLRDVPSPVPSRGEVRVRVRATALNRADLLQHIG
jgi:NADPH:quinone reductase-like Zn-dependent oxidoreductase